jgi:WD40 repeat protein
MNVLCFSTYALQRALIFCCQILQAITGISMPTGSDKLYSGSADGTVRLWDSNSGKVAGLSALNTSFRFFVHGSAWGCFSTDSPIACGGSSVLPANVINWGVDLLA